MFLAVLLIQAITVAPAPDPGVEARRRAERCVALAAKDPVAGEAEATGWRLTGGGHFARQCQGVALANQARWTDAAIAFSDAAQEAELTGFARAADYWAQAGNALLAAGEPAPARDALDRAIGPGALTGPPLGQAHLDRARARVALGDEDGAREDLDLAIANAPDEPLAWLLSATLARRMGQNGRAAADIGHAKELSPGNPAILLEAGNIAAASGDEPGAKAAWRLVGELAPDSREAASAKAALAQFDD